MQVSGPYLTIPHGGGDLYVPDFTGARRTTRAFTSAWRVTRASSANAPRCCWPAAQTCSKVIASGAVLAYGGVPGAPEMTRDEIAAVVEVAHAAGKKVAAHAHGAESIRMAIDAGVDTVEHASYLDDAGIAGWRCKRGNVALAMDVYNGDYIDTEGRRQNWPEEFLRKNLETTEIQRQAFTKAVKAGVPIVFATDAGVFPHGLNARQFPHHGEARHDAHAGHPVGHLGGRALHGPGSRRRCARSRQVRRPHRGARRSAVRHHGAASTSTWCSRAA